MIDENVTVHAGEACELCEELPPRIQCFVCDGAYCLPCNALHRCCDSQLEPPQSSDSAGLFGKGAK